MKVFSYFRTRAETTNTPQSTTSTPRRAGIITTENEAYSTALVPRLQNDHTAEGIATTENAAYSTTAEKIATTENAAYSTTAERIATTENAERIAITENAAYSTTLALAPTLESGYAAKRVADTVTSGEYEVVTYCRV